MDATVTFMISAEDLAELLSRDYSLLTTADYNHPVSLKKILAFGGPYTELSVSSEEKTREENDREGYI